MLHTLMKSCLISKKNLGWDENILIEPDYQTHPNIKIREKHKHGMLWLKKSLITYNLAPRNKLIETIKLLIRSKLIYTDIYYV
jgi:hypothetical protein